MRVALVDSGKLEDIKQWKPPLDSYLSRTLQITASNKVYLENHGLWSQCYADRMQPYDRAVVTDSLGGGVIDLAAFETVESVQSRSSVAYMIETKNFVSGMLKAIDCATGCVVTFERSRARLLVGADGASSYVRKCAGIGTYGSEYLQYGLVATLCLEQLNSTAYQRFLPTGPIAMLPFPGGFANLVWSLDSDHTQLLKSAPEGAFASLVNAAFRLSACEMQYLYNIVRDGASESAITAEADWRLEVFARNNPGISSPKLLPPTIAAITPKSRTSFPLRMRMVDSLIANRIALVGDAGHVMHPLAGQGLNMGLEDVQCLADVLKQAAVAGEDIGSVPVLMRYNKQRYVRNLAMQGIVDKTWHIFGSNSRPVVTARSLVMNGLDLFPTVKRFLVSSIMS
ncbi:putative ubiquinone biosynthesis monooxygenase [Coemansia umbellata]|uniref:Ubiquinone biosynthesis monooxygenase n=1 Tax=Coemansia umbellata TaxID=1424467 RepID=A0ABQ8PTS5_9FUNG|nr:putative ubiquinone biosynthesis monooxygenase [Coemansia umbellata]